MNRLVPLVLLIIALLLGVSSQDTTSWINGSQVSNDSVVPSGAHKAALEKRPVKTRPSAESNPALLMHELAHEFNGEPDAGVKR